MKFICSYEKIKTELELALPFTAQKNSLSITSYVLLENNNDLLTIKATDMKFGFSTTMPVETKEPGITLVYCEKLVEILRQIPEVESLEFSEEDKKLKIQPEDRSVNLNISLKCLDSLQFPTLLEADNNSYFKLPLDDFFYMADKTLFAISNDPARIFLTGVYLERKDENTLTMVATDGRKLGFVERKIEDNVASFPSAIVPDKFFKYLKSVSDNSEKDFLLSINENNIFAKTGNRFIYSSLISSKYPNYEKVIPKSFSNNLTVRTKDLDNALSLNSVLIDAKSRRIFLEIDKDGVLIYGDNNEYGESKQVIKCEYTGENVRLSFNSNIIIPAVKKVESEFMSICFNSPTQAIGIFPDPKKDYLFIVMPLQS